MNKKDIKVTIKYAGAFVAWVIGSGFATGQELLQFFSSYSYKSIAVLIVNLIGFAVLGVVMLTKGFDNRNTTDFNHYDYYCGKKIGKIYSFIIPITLIMVMSVLISAAGATLEQYYSVNRFLGTAVMSVLILIVYLLGFERLVKIVSGVGIFVIVFVLFVGLYTAFRDYSSFSEIGDYTDKLSEFQTAPHWAISSVLYLSLNFLSGSNYYTTLGIHAESRKSAKWGAIIGSAALVTTIALINFSILFNAKDILNVSVPTLYLAQKISHVFGAVFSVVLILGIFSACTTTVWSFCSGFFRNDVKKNRIFSAATVLVCMLLGFVPFGNLVAVLYPMIGYAGLFFIGAVAYKGISKKNK